MRLAVVVLVAVAALTAALPARAAERVSSGSLTAEVRGPAWSLAFRGSATLDEAPALRLGFRSGGAWSRAARILSSTRAADGALALRVATDDALGRVLAVRVAPSGEGAIALSAEVEGDGSVEALGIGFAARDGERYLGFGERSNAVDQRGGAEVESYVADGPYQLEERPFIAAVVPQPGFRARDDATYFPMPWLLSSAGHGVLVDNDEPSVHRLDGADAWSVEVATARLRLRVLGGPRPADVLRRLTLVTGRQPAPGADWFFGPWFQPRSEEDGRRLRAADAPVSVAQTYTHYLPCEAHVSAADPGKERRRSAHWHGLGMAVTTYFNPMVCTSAEAFGQAESRGVLTRDATGRPLTYRYGASADAEDQFLVGQVDFSTPAGRAFYGELLAEAVADGYDGWMEDFGEYTPLDARSADGTPGRAMHNRYPVLYHRASSEYARSGRAPRPVAGFIRSGWTGVHPYAQLVWGGDPTTDWGFDGLRSAVHQGLTIGLSGISRWGSDIGGFFALGRRRLTPELLQRWIELGAVSGIMRTQANGVAVPSKTRPQILDPEVLPVWRRYAKLRTQLHPYWVAADAEYRRTGMPLMRHGALTHPSDPGVVARDDQFMVGADLLAAPVLEPGAARRDVRLPAGLWVDGLAYRASDGAFLARPRAPVLTGRRSVSLEAPLDTLPLLVRAGAVLPLLSADVDTLADAYDTPDVVSRRDRASRLRLLAFPRGSSRSRFGERGTLISREHRRSWRLDVRGARGRRVSLQASLVATRRPLRPCGVTVDGHRVPSSYDRAAAVLRVAFTARGRVARVRVARCGRRGGGGGPRLRVLHPGGASSRP